MNAQLRQCRSSFAYDAEIDDEAGNSYLQEAFNSASQYLASAVSSGDKSIDNAAKLAFYGLYKQATVGKCSTSRPGLFDFAGRSKWDAWNKLGDLSKDASMQQYVALLSKHTPAWTPPSSSEAGPGGGAKRAGARAKQAMGPVFSSPAAAVGEEVEDADGMDGEESPALHAAVGASNQQAVQALLEAGADVHARDSDGCTALHLAADRGSLPIAHTLLTAGADTSACDNDGQTPLHYAALCGHEQMCTFLLREAGADATAADSSGQTAKDLGQSGWSCWTQPTL